MAKQDGTAPAPPERPGPGIPIAGFRPEKELQKNLHYGLRDG